MERLTKFISSQFGNPKGVAGSIVSLIQNILNSAMYRGALEVTDIQPDEKLLDMRACKKGGKVIIPTYVNNENAGKPSLFIRGLEKFGADFKKQFDFETYKEFFAKSGLTDIEYKLVTGKMPCAIAIITKR